MRLQAIRLSAAVFAAAALAACGGGGGGGGAPSPVLPVPPAPPPPPPPPATRPPPVVFPTGATPDTSSAEFTRNWGVGGVKAEAAWTRGFTGKNVIIGVVDDGLIPSDPEIAGRVHPGSKDIVDARGQLTGPGTHGTELAVFMAGAFNGVATVGVAYEATILGVRADDPACTGTNCGFQNADLARAIDYATAQGAQIINLSLGSSSASSTTLRDAIARATAAGVIVVNSAGNDGPLAPDVNFPGRYASDPTVSNGLILTVGAIGPTGAMASFSNVAGPTQNWFVVAPGDQVFTVDSGAVGATDPAFQTCFPDFTCRMQGTSYSAPHVAGVLALLRQAFPGLTAQQLVQLVLRSSDDLGATGVDSTFGYGRVNVATAFTPIGPLSTPLSGAAGSVPVGAGLGTVGAAFGDSFAAPGAWSTVAFDEFGRTFSVDLAPAWRRSPRDDVAEDAAPTLWSVARDARGVTATAALADPAPALDRRTPDLERAFRLDAPLAPGWSLAVAAHTPAMVGAAAPQATGAYGLAGRDAAVALTRDVGRAGAISFFSQSGARRDTASAVAGKASAAGVRVTQSVAGVDLSASLGNVRETGRALGAAIDMRAGAAPYARTTVGALSLSAPLAARLRLDLSGETGRSRVTGGPAWLQPAGDLSTSAGRVALTYGLPPAQGLNQSLTLSLEQPLRVERGAFQVLLPDADAWGRARMTLTARQLDAAPSGREHELRLGYTAWAGDRLAAQASLGLRREPGHDRKADAEATARIGVRVAY